MNESDWLRSMLYGKQRHPAGMPRWFALWTALVLAVLLLCAYAMLYQSRLLDEQERYIERLEQTHETNTLTRIQDELTNPQE